MQHGTMVRVYIGGHWGDDHPDAHTPIPQLHDRVLALVINHVQGATILDGQDVWMGSTEPCKVVEVFVPRGDDATRLRREISRLAARAKVELHQDAILITETPTSAAFV